MHCLQDSAHHHAQQVLGTFFGVYPNKRDYEMSGIRAMELLEQRDKLLEATK
jgi:hypothetical protein